jgi:hypothetical protein
MDKTELGKSNKFSWKMGDIKIIKKNDKLGVPKLSKLIKKQKKA